MKTIYFNLYNGEVCDPSEHLPTYKATISKGKISEISTCFRTQNIIDHGYEWLENLLDKERDEWSNFSYLMESLKSYIKQWKLLHPIKDTNFKEKEFYRFIFIPFWRGEDI